MTIVTMHQRRVPSGTRKLGRAKAGSKKVWDVWDGEVGRLASGALKRQNIMIT